MPAGRRGRPTTPVLSCKTRDTCNGIIEFNGVAVTFADDNRGNGQLALREHIKCGQGMADRAKIPANHQQYRNIECRHPVKHGALPLNRNHDSADAFDEQWSGRGADGRLAE